MFSKILARQLSSPSSILSRWVLAPLWNRRNSALNDLAFEKLDLQPGDRVLEVGFGGGYLLQRMSQVVIRGALVGVDVSSQMHAFCMRRFSSLVQSGRMELKLGEAESLPCSPGAFNKACSVNSIFYWKNPPLALQELRRVLEPGGLLVLCYTSKESLQTKSFSRHGVALHTPAEIEQMLRDAGFPQAETSRHADRHRVYWCTIGKKVPLFTKRITHGY